MHTMPLDHAKQKLIFYVAQDLDQTIKSDVQEKGTDYFWPWQWRSK
jgi:hypothetical protein